MLLPKSLLGFPIVKVVFKMLGTERCNEALQKLEKKYDVVVNIQADEPLIEPEVIDGIVKALQVNLFLLLFSNNCQCEL